MKERSYSEIESNYQQIIQSIAQAAQKSGRDPEDIHLMAVTKTVPVEFVNFAIQQGVTLIGENRAQELLEKFPMYHKENLEIHFIGHLQTNKVKQIIDKVTMIESVDSVKLAQEIDKQANLVGKTMDFLVEINIGEEVSKSGVLKQDLESFLEQVEELEHIRFRGLMAIPPISGDNYQSRSYFEQMRNLFIDIREKTRDNRIVNVLSMGMSNDYIAAIESGSNLVRIGTGLFGRR